MNLGGNKNEAKKQMVSALAGVLAASVALTSTASAHTGDIWGGKYIGTNKANILLRINQSAQTSLLNWKNVYSYGYNWNNISSNVKVSMIYIEGPCVPSMADEMHVYGDSSLGNYLGLTLPYDSKGNRIGYDDNWAYVRITMNTASSAFSAASNPTLAAKKTFLHEIGHALKLCHPIENSNYSGHTKANGIPIAIMNQGFPGTQSGATSSYITDHDRSCLKAKWGV